jgi:hypothetical protein
VGLIAWTRQANPRIGVLMSAVGLTWFVEDLGWIYQPLPYTVAFLGEGFRRRQPNQGKKEKDERLFDN